MTKKNWEVEHLPQETGQPETKQSASGPSDTPSQDAVDSWKKPNSDEKVKDSALLPTDPADFRRPDPSLDIEESSIKLKYPRSVFFIIINEFCERFTYYGLQTVLSLYFISNLAYSENKATAMYHMFSMLCYFFPLVGAIIADSWLGKYYTILYLSIVYSAGSVLISIASSHFGSRSLEEPLALLGLLLIAIGTGGIKPCVSAFGGDQFKLPEQRLQLQRFFSVYYFAINSGSLISSTITPIFRQDVTCFGMQSCYPLAFGVPAVAMVLSLVVFVCGKPMYKIIPPQGNVLVRVCSCIGSAVSNRRKRTSSSSKQRWIDYADSKYDAELRDDIMSVLRVLVLFLPLPVFWALFDQQGSRWTFQALNMNGRIGFFTIKPDQMQIVNPVLILVLLPTMEGCVYPCLSRLNLLRKPLQKIGIGGLLACLSFVISALLEFQLEKHYPVRLTSDLAQVRIFNLAPCQLHLSSDSFSSPVDLNEMEMNAQLALKAIGETTFSVNVSGLCVRNTSLSLPMEAKTAQSVYLYKHNEDVAFGEAPGEDTVVKNSNVNPVVRFMYKFEEEGNHSIELKASEKTELTVTTNTSIGATAEYAGTSVGTYSVWVDGAEWLSDLTLDVSGTYSLLVNDSSVESITVMEPNTIHMLWLVPQYFVITIGEIMFSVTGVEFSFTQAPVSMKSVLASAWLLTVAFGNLIVLVVAESQFFESHAWEFVMFAALMFVDMAIFALIAMRYKYRDDSVSSSDSDNTILETTTNSNSRTDITSTAATNDHDAQRKEE